MPELAYGGGKSSKSLQDGLRAAIRSQNEQVSARFAVLGLCNDEIGYIVPAEDFGNFLTENHYEEAISLGKQTANEILSAFSRAAGEATKTIN